MNKQINDPLLPFHHEDCDYRVWQGECMTGPYQHNGSVKACSQYLADNVKSPDIEKLQDELLEAAARTFETTKNLTFTDALAYARNLLEQHDQQRLDAALAAVHNNRHNHCTENEQYGYPCEYDQATDQAKAALPAALAPDNSSVEENHE